MSDLPVLNTSDPAYAHDPYAVLAPIAEAGPVVRTMVDGLAVWLVTGYDEAVEALSSPRMSIDGIKNSGPEAREVFWAGAADRGLQSHMGRMDPPDHTRLRGLVQQTFTPRRVAALEPWIRGIVRERIEAFPSGDAEVDLMAAFALPVPIAVIAELLGIDVAQRSDFRHWADTILQASEQQEQVAAAAEAARRIMEMFAALVAQRRAAVGEVSLDISHEGTLIDGLIRAHDDGDALNERELLSLLFLLLGAGYETTANLIGNGMLTLLSDPARLAAVQADPTLLPVAIEEFLRLDPPVKVVFPRYPLADVELGGALIRAGEPVLVHFSAVSRDERRFNDPSVYRPGRGADRSEPSHLTFGYGLHHCLGAPLARLEARIAFDELLRTYPDIELVGPVEKLRREHSRLFRGLSALPVRLGERAL
ncbi:cytochrome P450 [Catenulispora acidiphila DSM 44928]|uniref:Cytochrome P450 n=1 Tax=Catenulispora acidiphila (strain DSM 44928 / JCM 14897 / NBRC 102108 / NRRL B-24433 / ID139908) TaxID=479433 RepID=C7PWA0_CATAD|nr:cytochrome P450 [Catenulispora acidiphila]ACU73348.1 cytochrome P450 [Catenulispora acidiphila DSM 44928]